jgi:hypothetical protein
MRLLLFLFLSVSLMGKTIITTKNQSKYFGVIVNESDTNIRLSISRAIVSKYEVVQKRDFANNLGFSRIKMLKGNYYTGKTEEVTDGIKISESPVLKNGTIIKNSDIEYVKPLKRIEITLENKTSIIAYLVSENRLFYEVDSVYNPEGIVLEKKTVTNIQDIARESDVNFTIDSVTNEYRGWVKTKPLNKNIVGTNTFVQVNNGKLANSIPYIAYIGGFYIKGLDDLFGFNYHPWYLPALRLETNIGNFTSGKDSLFISQLGIGVHTEFFRFDDLNTLNAGVMFNTNGIFILSESKQYSGYNSGITYYGQYEYRAWRKMSIFFELRNTTMYES